MKKSMPPPVPPKRRSSNSITVKTNIDPALDNNRSQSNGSSSSNNSGRTSHDAVINHNHGPNILIAQSNELHKLSNASMYKDNGMGHTTPQKGQSNCSRLDSVADCKNDPKTASGFNAGTVPSDNNKKLNDDIVGQSTTLASTKSGTNSGISHHCDNGMTITCLIRCCYFVHIQILLQPVCH